MWAVTWRVIYGPATEWSASENSYGQDKYGQDIVYTTYIYI